MYAYGFIRVDDFRSLRIIAKNDKKCLKQELLNTRKQSGCNIM